MTAQCATKSAVIIDHGSSKLKFGTSDHTNPVIIPVTYISKFATNTTSKIEKLFCIKSKLRSSLVFEKYPTINRYNITNWDQIVEIWHNLYDILNINATEHPVLMAESFLSPMSNREKIAELMFESNEVPALALLMRSCLSLISQGKNSGVVIESGHKFTYITPYYDGCTFPCAMSSNLLGGDDIRNALEQNLLKREYTFKTLYEKQVLNDIKEKLCYVSKNLNQDCCNKTMEKYEFPDGRTINIGHERFKSPEVLFDPSLIGKNDIGGIHKLIYNTTKKCSIDTRKFLLQNICLSGGNTQFPNFSKRLRNEILNLFTPNYINVEVNVSLLNQYSAWIGGSILAKRSVFKDLYVTKMEYQEYGSNIVHSRFVKIPRILCDTT